MSFLRPYATDDAEILFELVNVFDEQNRTKQFSNINSAEDAKKIIDEVIEADNEWLLVHKESQKPIGWVTCEKIVKTDMKKKVFIYAWLRNEYKYMNFGRELLEKVLHFAFYGIKTSVVFTNAREKGRFAYPLFIGYGFELYKKASPKDINRIAHFKIPKEKYINQNHVVAETYDYEPPVPAVKMKSRYSTENPVRKIDNITFIAQPTEYLCGQAVIAMLAGVSVDEVISVMQNDKGTSTQELRNALKWYGLKTAANARLKYSEGTKLPDCCILSVMLPGYGHWSLYFKGKYYDPEFGVMDKLPEQARLRYYWEVLL
ncbi:MAG: GNAT family N-acetyltransferase [Eubacteriales bacterium]|nr:GNAT family N-acetyltransferase [Eubacteriales bacterium]